MNKKTTALTVEQYELLISLIKNGGEHYRGNEQVALACILEANLGIRISDILKLKLSDIVKDGDRLHLNIIEQKTQKTRQFTVLPEIYQYLQSYCIKNKIGEDDIILPITERAVQKKIAQACEQLGLEGISSHSFRKFFATQIYLNNNYDIRLVQELLQHSEIKTTQRYIGISSAQVENALKGHLHLL